MEIWVFHKMGNGADGRSADNESLGMPQNRQ